MFKSFWDKKQDGKQGKGNYDKKYSQKGSGKRSFSKGDTNSRGMHKATCDTCGNPCEVPFKPTSGKPLYCRDCFKKDGTGPVRSGGRDFGRRDNSSSHSQSGSSDIRREQFKKMNEKLDKILEILTSEEAF